MFHVEHFDRPLLPMDIKVTNVSRETHDIVDAVFFKNHPVFERMAKRWLFWNSSVNIFSGKFTIDDVLVHIKHSLYLYPYLRPDSKLIVDAGTGGGLPGLPLSVVDNLRRYVLIDKVRKKSFVVKDLIKSFALIHAIAECADLRNFKSSESFDIVTKHAFHIHDLLEILDGNHWHCLLMLKGDDVFSELESVNGLHYSCNLFSLDNKHDVFFRNKYLLKITNIG